MMLEGGGGSFPTVCCTTTLTYVLPWKPVGWTLGTSGNFLLACATGVLGWMDGWMVMGCGNKSALISRNGAPTSELEMCMCD